MTEAIKLDQDQIAALEAAGIAVGHLPSGHSEWNDLVWQVFKAGQRYETERLENENVKLREALEGLYEHTRNNYQICSLNERARDALAACARNDLQARLRAALFSVHESQPNPAGEELFKPQDDDTIGDGFGSEWSAWCPMCGQKSMQVLKPGKAQCDYCG